MAVRLDATLVRLGLAVDIAGSQKEIRSGNVLVNDVVVDKVGASVPSAASVRLRRIREPFVSRGGRKLAAALDAFAIDPRGRVCADLGASTGGFTDCLLQRGAARVYAIDVGYGQLDWRLRSDARVVTMERTNARTLESLPEPISLLVGDLSFISLRAILPTARRLLHAGDAVVLVKPQFELPPDRILPGGRAEDDEARRDALASVESAAKEAGFVPERALESPLPGARAGNREWLLWLTVVS